MRDLISKLERHTHALYWSDGLLDLLAGVGLVLIGVAWIVDVVVFGAIAPALLLPLWGPLRRRVVEPRRGYVELGEDRQRAMVRLTLGLLLAGGGTFAGALVAYRVGLEMAILVRTLPGALVGMAALAIAGALELRRFAGYALGLVGVAIGSGLAGFNPGWAFVAGGVIAVGVGVGLLVSFLRRYPQVAAEPELRPEAG
jgi:MFS family permease